MRSESFVYVTIFESLGLESQESHLCCRLTHSESRIFRGYVYKELSSFALFEKEFVFLAPHVVGIFPWFIFVPLCLVSLPRYSLFEVRESRVIPIRFQQSPLFRFLNLFSTTHLLFTVIILVQFLCCQS